MYHREDQHAFSAKIDEKFRNLQKSKFQTRNVSPTEPNAGWQTPQRSVRSKVQTVQMLQTAGLNGAEKGAVPKRKNTQEELRYIVDATMRQFQQIIIELGERVNRATSLSLMVIFFRAGLAMIFNAYNLVVFFLRLANNSDEQHLGVAEALVYYGFHIFSAALDVLLTIVGFAMVYNKLLQFAALIANNLRKYTHFGLYNLDGTFIWAVVAGITTYIIILVQYGIDDDGKEQFR